MIPETVAVLYPTASAQAGDMPIALRLDDLNGKVLGFLWNTKPNGDILLRRIQERLSERFHLNDAIWRQKPGAAMSGGQIIKEFSETVDAVVNAVGD
jgi:hypothetical protein